MKRRLRRKTHPYDVELEAVFTGCYEHPYLTPAMDSRLCLGLAEAAREASSASGDFIDAGLVLVKALRDRGFAVSLIE